MSQKFEYAVVQLADRNRDERLNAALAIFSDSGLDIRVPRRLEKLRAMSAAIDLDDVRAAIEQLKNFDRILRDQGCRTPTERVNSLSSLTTLRISLPCQFIAPSLPAYEDWVSRLLKTLIEPEPNNIKNSQKRTRLLAFVKSAFRSERVLAKKGEDLSDHRLVTNVQIAEGLSADLVLKNGSMHVIETVDASDEATSIRKIVANIAVSALVLEQARMTFGESGTKSRLIYDASSTIEKIAMPSLQAAANQGTELINWASQDDRNRLITEISELATPYEIKTKHKANMHASAQRNFDLN